jgi:hypothetical protein
MPDEDEAGHRAHYSLYGRADGTWAILRAPDFGWVPPPSVGDLRRLGDATAVILALYLQIPGAGTGHGGRGRYPAQEMIAQLTGLSQTGVSLHIRTGTKMPNLSDDRWRALTRLLYAWTEWPDKPCDHAAVAEFLATGEQIRWARGLPGQL